MLYVEALFDKGYKLQALTNEQKMEKLFIRNIYPEEKIKSFGTFVVRYNF